MVAPLDWGLGHATRCIPLIRELLAKNCEVIIAGSGASLTLLRNEFPGLTFEELPDYRIRYSSSSSQSWKIATQLPLLLKMYWLDRRATEKIVVKHDVKVILSDNRYGCRSTRALSIFVGHQVNLRMPERLSGLSSLVNRLHSGLVAKFDRWWVPDFAGPESLAGALSESNRPGLTYIGPLSRFGRIEKTTKTFDLAFLLSGPEPQRTLFEQWVIEAAAKTTLRIALIRGTDTPLQDISIANLSVFHLLATREVVDIIAKSDVVVARSGYTTIMDLYHTGGRAVLVPTPGQTEQEYLARHIAAQGYAGYVEQHRLSLASIVQTASAFTGFPGKNFDGEALGRSLDDVLALRS